ncbi:MAG: type II secretion system protein GspK [Candidatus Omnitrophica bacterium]|nr:type II secretion system protein GspK [Candidatus Omnitrophota bacterium]
MKTRCKEGSILIIALWSIFLLTVFAVTLSYGVRYKLTLVKKLEARDKIRFLNEACIKRAIFEVKRARDKQYFFLKGASAHEAALFDDNEVDVPNDFPGVTKRSPLIIIFSGFTGQAGIFDEERKININTASISTLERLFKIVLEYDDMEAQDLAASIIDWRDADSLLTVPLGSAEDSYYRNFPYAYEAKDAPFEAIEELLLVKGVTKEIFEKIKKYITIYGDGRININTAPAHVLAALGLHGALVSKIIAFRCGEDGIIGTSDDGVVDFPGNVVSAIEKRTPLNIAEVKQLELIAEQLTTSPGYFMIKSVTYARDKRDSGKAVCIIDKSGKILYWHEF